MSTPKVDQDGEKEAANPPGQMLRILYEIDGIGARVDAGVAPLLRALIKAGPEGLGDLDKWSDLQGQLRRLLLGYRVNIEVRRCGSYGSYEQRAFLQTPLQILSS